MLMPVPVLPEHSGDVVVWLATDAAWIPVPTSRHGEVFGRLITTCDARGNLIPDAHLAALAIEHGVGVCSADSDFACFAELNWLNPLAPRS